MDGAGKIRSARPEDAAALAELNGQLGYETTPEVMEPRLRAALEEPGRAVLVLDRNGVVLGWIGVAMRSSLQDGNVAEIDALIVSEGERERGRTLAWVPAGVNDSNPLRPRQQRV